MSLERAPSLGRALPAILLLAAFGVPLPLAGQIPISGQVVTTAGKPVSEAEIEILPVYTSYQRETSFFRKGEFFPQPIARARAAGSGHFTVRAPGAGMWTVVVRAAGFVTMDYQLAPLLEPTTLPPVALRRDVGTTVTIDTGDGETTATVWMATWPMSWQLWRQGRGDGWRPRLRLEKFGDDSTLTTPRGEGEEVRLRFFAPGYVETVVERVRGEASVTLPPVTTPPIRLLVRDARGRPEPDVMVLAGGGAWTQGLTDERGAVSFLHPNPDMPWISLRTPNGFVHRLPLPPAEFTEPVVVDLEPRILSGLVVEAETRKPIEGAWVWNHGRKIDAVRTNVDGEYEMVSGAGRSARIQATAVGYMQGWAPQQSSPEAARQPPVSLRPAAAIQGWVVDRDARPVAGATVTVGERYLQPGFSTWTGEDGSFYLGQLPPVPRAELVVRKEGLVEKTQELPPLTPFEVRDGVRVVLGVGAVAFGHVVDIDLQPIPGVLVTLRKPAEDAIDRATRWFQDGDAWNVGTDKLGSTATDTEGRFELPNAPQGLFDLTLRAEGFAPRSLLDLEIPEGTEASDLGQLVLEDAAVISGLVVDTRDRPLEGARIYAFPNQQGMSFNFPAYVQNRTPDSLSDRDGRFAIDFIEPGVSIHLIAALDGYTMAGLPGVEAPTSEDVRVELTRGATVSGRVVDSGGEPVRGASVHLKITEQALVPGSMGRLPKPTGRDGRFVFAGVVPGSIQLAAMAPGYPPTFLDGIELEPGRALEGIELRLSPGAALSGRVVDTAGAPIAGARVSYFHRFVLEFHRSGSPTSVTTDDAGAYRLTGLPIGTEQVTADVENHENVSVTLDLAPGENTHDFVIEAGAAVSGTVVDAADQPVAGAWVGLQRIDGQSRRFHHERSDATGAFQARGVAPGQYRLQATRQGLASADLDEPLDVGIDGVSGLVLRLGAGITLSGRVLGVEPPHLTQVVVTARREMLHGGQSPVSQDGTYRIANLGAGTWTVSAAVGGPGRQIVRIVEIDAGNNEDLVLDLDFSAGVELAGTVLADGEPRVGLQLTILRGDEQVAGQMTDYRGRFRFQGLEPGTYVVVIGSDRTGLPVERGVELSQDREIVIDLSSATSLQ